ncbi:MAG TPA: septation protein A [Gammaproteobacteria bacterium]|nr:septation protein A [Gammaproteobacteria bacterium]
MKLLFDFFPIFLFFIAFKFFGIYIATATTMLASLLQVGIYWLKHRRFESLHIITLVTVVLLGGSTLLLHNDLFIKWKPTAIYWVFALAFLSSQFIGKKPLIQRLLDSKLSLPRNVWQRLNVSWILFFVLMGIANIYVLYHFSTNAWVNFKLFGTLGLTLVFMVIQAIYMTKYMDTKNNTPQKLPKPNTIKNPNSHDF